MIVYSKCMTKARVNMTLCHAISHLDWWTLTFKNKPLIQMNNAVENVVFIQEEYAFDQNYWSKQLWVIKHFKSMQNDFSTTFSQWTKTCAESHSCLRPLRSRTLRLLSVCAHALFNSPQLPPFPDARIERTAAAEFKETYIICLKNTTIGKKIHALFLVLFAGIDEGSLLIRTLDGVVLVGIERSEHTWGLELEVYTGVTLTGWPSVK